MMKLAIGRNKSTIYEKLYFIIIFLAIYCSQDTLFFGTNANTSVTETVKYLPLLFIIAWLFLKPRLNAKHLILPALMCVMLMLTCFVNGEAVNNYVYRCAILIVAFLLIEYDKDLFWKYFSKIMTFLCVWSIVTFVLNIVLPSVINMFPLIKNVAGHSYRTILFSNISIDTIYSISRNHGIFREPGVFVVFIVIAMINELKQVDNLNIKRFLIYTIAMLTTMSTAGYIILAAMYIYIIVLRKDFKYKKTSIVIISTAIVYLVGFTDILQSDHTIWTKFQYGTNHYGSWYARLSSLIANFEIALENPIFGVGRYKLYDTVLATSGVYAAVANTNTLLINFAAFGFLYGIIHVIGLVKYSLSSERTITSSIFVFVLLIAALSNEDMGQNILYYVILFNGLFLTKAKKVKSHNSILNVGIDTGKILVR